MSQMQIKRNLLGFWIAELQPLFDVWFVWFLTDQSLVKFLEADRCLRFNYALADNDIFSPQLEENKT